MGASNPESEVAWPIESISTNAPIVSPGDPANFALEYAGGDRRARVRTFDAQRGGHGPMPHLLSARSDHWITKDSND